MERVRVAVGGSVLDDVAVSVVEGVAEIVSVPVGVGGGVMVSDTVSELVAV